MIFVSQFSTTHCVQALGLSIYVVSCYFQYSDEIEGYLRRLEKVFHSLRGERLIGGRCRRSRVSLRLMKEEGSFKSSSMFNIKVINEAYQGSTFETRRGLFFIDVTWCPLK